MPLSVNTYTSTASAFQISCRPVIQDFSFSSHDAGVTLTSVILICSRPIPSSGCARVLPELGAAPAPSPAAPAAEPKSALREMVCMPHIRPQPAC